MFQDTLTNIISGFRKNEIINWMSLLHICFMFMGVQFTLNLNFLFFVTVICGGIILHFYENNNTMQKKKTNKHDGPKISFIKI